MRKWTTLAVFCLLLGTVPAAALDLRVVGGESMGIPFWLSADLGLVIGTRSTNEFRGMKVSAEIGIGGTKELVGYYYSRQYPYSRNAFSIGGGWMRTFGSPLLADSWCSHLGIEAQLSITAFMPITLRCGVWSRIDHLHPQFSVAFGFGL